MEEKSLSRGHGHIAAYEGRQSASSTNVLTLRKLHRAQPGQRFHNRLQLLHKDLKDGPLAIAYFCAVTPAEWPKGRGD
jgi:hypothetical protein